MQAYEQYMSSISPELFQVQKFLPISFISEYNWIVWNVLESHLGNCTVLLSFTSEGFKVISKVMRIIFMTGLVSKWVLLSVTSLRQLNILLLVQSLSSTLPHWQNDLCKYCSSVGLEIKPSPRKLSLLFQGPTSHFCKHRLVGLHLCFCPLF